MFSHDLTIKSLLKPQVIPNTHGKKKYAIILWDLTLEATEAIKKKQPIFNISLALWLYQQNINAYYPKIEYLLIIF
jgi:hypothetical protein